MSLIEKVAREVQSIEGCFEGCQHRMGAAKRIIEAMPSIKWQKIETLPEEYRAKKGQAVFTNAVNDVIQQHIPRDQWATSFCPSSNDPCLQVADYCTWAIQRKWERGDTRSFDIIKSRITYEYDLWQRGTVHYY